MNNILKIIGCAFVLLTLTSNAVASTPYLQQINISNHKQQYQPLNNQGGWPQIYTGGYQDNALNIDIDSEDNIIVTGFSFQESTCNAYTIKYDGEGNELWSASYNSGTFDVGFSLIVDDNDDILVYGYSGKLPVSEGDCFIVKYSSKGIEQWNYTFNKGECNYPGGITVDSENNIIITGGSGIWQMNIYYWTIKMDENCIELWNHTFHEAAIDLGLGITVDSQDNIIVTGFSSTPFVDPTFLIKYDKDGKIVWEKRRPEGEPWDIATDSQDNIIIAGTGYYGQTITMFTSKYDKDGTLLWTDEFDSGAYDGCRSIAIDSQDNIIVGGFSGYSNSNYYENCAIIYDFDGNEICLKRQGVEGMIYGVAVDSKDVMYITGVIEEGIHAYYTTKFTDIIPPSVQLEKPKSLYLHLFGMPLLQLPRKTIAIGKLIVSLESENPSDIDYIEVYINKLLMIKLLSPPFEWTWEDCVIGKRTIEVIAYDSTGSAQRIELSFWKFL